MPDLSILTALTYAKSGGSIATNYSASVSLTSNTAIKRQQLIPTSDTPIDFGAIAQSGYVSIKNLDATNYVVIGFDGSTYPLSLNPGEFAIFRLDITELHILADTAACLVELTLLPK